MRKQPLNKLFGLGIALAVIFGAWSTWSARRVSASDPSNPISQAFGMVGITNGQTMQLNVSNLRSVDPSNPIAPVDVEMFFLDGDGSVRKQTSLRLTNGQSANLSLNADEVMRDTGRLQLRALVRFNEPPSPIRGDRRQDRLEPVIVSSVEVLDNATNRTNFVLGEPPSPIHGQ